MSQAKGSKKADTRYTLSSWIIVYKLILGIIETVLAIALIIYGKHIFTLYYSFRDQALLENAPDILVELIEKILPYLMEHRGLIVLILLLLGVTKVAGAIGLYYKQHWGLDLLIGLTFLFLPFDLISLLDHATWAKLTYFIINILIALYLVNFKPQAYFQDLRSRLHIK